MLEVQPAQTQAWREKVVKMDRKATAKMLQHHPDRAGPELRKAFTKAEQEPAPPRTDRGELLQAARAASTSEELGRLCRQIVLFLISEQCGAEEAARALSTIPESVRAARNRIAPIVSVQALEVTATVECFNRILALFVIEQTFRLTCRDIIKICGRVFGIAESDLLSARRSRGVVYPRQVAMFLCKRLTPRSMPEIGKQFGGRDHTTVLHATRKIQEIADDLGLDCGQEAEAWATSLRAVSPTPTIRQRKYVRLTAEATA